MVNKITFSDTENLKDIVYIDTRSPGEYEKDNIPGSVNIPIFDNEERAIVGTIYTKISQDKAYEKARDIYIKKLQEIKQELIRNDKNTLIIYCWRGGMRSKVITELAQELKIKAFQLNGGYKSYRKHVREELQRFRLRPRLVVLHGLTGSGKTEILQHFADKIDLEDISQHRSSVFGAIGLKPRSQKMFESLLLKEMKRLNSKKHILIEGESNKIGNCHIPPCLFKAMKKGINIMIECSFQSRVKRSRDTYLKKADGEQLKAIVCSIQKKLGKKITAKLLSHVEHGEKDEFAELLLTRYYDPLYMYSIAQIEPEQILNSDNMNHLIESIRTGYSIK